MIDPVLPAPRQKHEMVRERLTESLRSGEFVVGRRLPGDKDLATRFGVSYMTARQAVNELVAASILERRIGDGTYVREGSLQRLSTTSLNLICTSYEGSTTKTFLQLAGSAAQRRGWRAHIIRIHPHHELGALRALESGELCLVLADDEMLKGSINKAMRGAKARAVLLGWRMDEEGVPSVLADDAQGVALAMSHLKKLGHENIALVCNHPASANERVQIEAWRSLLPAKMKTRAQGWLIEAKTPIFQCASRFAYNATEEWLKKHNSNGEVTALISVSDELALGTMCACRDAGFSIPEAMSLVNLSDSAAMEFANPRVTCVDVNLEAHVESAIAMLESMRGYESQGAAYPTLKLVNPRLIERESTRRSEKKPK